MELTNAFTVALHPDEAWAVLTDVERIAPCMPGAELQEVEGDEYRGIVKVKVGPITARYKGTATFESRDQTNGRLVLRAEGREARGQGNASARIVVTLAPDGEGTRVSLSTDLTITGKVSQLGRGVLADVSTRLLTQFVESLESEVLVRSESLPNVPNATDASTATEPPEAGTPLVRKVASRPAEPVDLLGTAGLPIMRRLGPGIAVGFGLLWLLRRKRNHKGIFGP